MVLATFNAGLQAVVARALIVGVGFITVQDAAVTTAGILLTILGLMGLMPVVKQSLLENPA